MRYFSTRGADQFLSFEEVRREIHISCSLPLLNAGFSDSSRWTRPGRRAIHPRTRPFSTERLADRMEGPLIHRPLCRCPVPLRLA